MNKIQHEKIAAWKEFHMKKCNSDKIKHKMSATQKKCDMKRKQEEATREKVQLEKSARMKYAKKVHKNSRLECTKG